MNGNVPHWSAFMTVSGQHNNGDVKNANFIEFLRGQYTEREKYFSGV